MSATANNKPIVDNSIVGKRSIQNLSCNWTGSTDFGRIVPFQWTELLGTDKVETCKPRIELQMLPLASPTFGKLDIYCHYFFVPTRLLVKGFRDIMNDDGVYKNAQLPYWTMRDFQTIYENSATSGIKRSLFNHWTSMGLPPFFTFPSATLAMDNVEPISLLPFRAYNQIYWDYFRDPELLRDTNRELYLLDTNGRQSTDMASMFYYPRYRNIKDTWIANLFAQNGLSPSGEWSGMQKGGADTNLYVYSTDKTSAYMRKIEALTRLAERMSLSGKRSIDLLFTRYGIKPEWDKLNMCQYVGGGKSSVLVSDITSTADTTAPAETLTGMPLGAKAGQGYAQLRDVNINFTATEPGILMGVLSIMPHVHFVQGIGQEWKRRYRTDFFTKELEHVGQVAVPRREVGVRYYNDLAGNNGQSPAYVPANDGQTFAFSEPYYEYKRGVDVLAGDFMKYHSASFDSSDPSSDARDVQYMQSMEMYIDYPANREYNPENITLRPLDFNKIFYYLGGNAWSDADDHFHLCIDKEISINRPMDGYSVPTLETTEDPHASKAPLSKSVEL